jgi:DNA replication initiation complex subunit (GINS family)
MRTRYTRLHEAWDNEIKREELQNIPDDFLHEMKNYTNQLNKTPANTGTLSGNLTQTERKYANQMLKELSETRLNKIIRSELNGLAINAQAMTPEEQQLHSNLRQLLTGYRQGAELPIVRAVKPEPQPAVTKKDSTPPPPKIEVRDTELVLVRFLQSLPAIMGIDMKAYGPFQPEELATIPRQNAENLIKRGIAKKVEADV